MCKLAQIRKIIKNKEFPSWPKGITFEYKNNMLTLCLTREAVGLKKKTSTDKNGKENSKWINMQDASACFEAWAIGLKALNQNKDIEKICLKVDWNLPEFDEKFKEEGKKLSGHYGRFLYRALRFSEQYGGDDGWFELCGKKDDSKTLKGAITQFEEKILVRNDLVTNVPAGDASEPKKSPELIVEYLMAENNDEKKVLKECLKEADLSFDEELNVHHQLPVGLFSGGVVSKETALFTYGHSDIDLWVINANKLYVVELKAKKNDMLGIVTEIFFYSNYLYDLLVDKKFNKNIEDENLSEFRGYTDLCGLRGVENLQIQGVMLADSYHPLLEKSQKAILRVMNGSDKIQYSMASYEFEEENNTITISKGNFSAFWEKLKA